MAIQEAVSFLFLIKSRKSNRISEKVSKKERGTGRSPAATAPGHWALTCSACSAVLDFTSSKPSWRFQKIDPLSDVHDGKVYLLFGKDGTAPDNKDVFTFDGKAWTKVTSKNRTVKAAKLKKKTVKVKIKVK